MKAKEGGYRNPGDMEFEDYFVAPLFLTYHFFQKTYFSPYVGIGGGYLRSIKREYVGPLKLDSNDGDYETTTKSSFVPAAVVGINFLKIKRVNINLNVKVFPLETWGGERTSKERLLAFVFSPGAVFNF